MSASRDPESAGDDFSTTAALTLQAMKGHRESLAAVVARLDPFIRAAAIHRIGPKLRRWCEPEDLAQEAGAVLCRQLPSLDFQGPGAGRAVMKFLATSIQLQVENLVRKHRRLGREEGGDHSSARRSIDELPEEVTSMLSGLARREAREAVDRALALLPAKDRELVILRGIEQHRYEELAVLLGASAGALRTRYHRVLKRLQDLLPESAVEEFLGEA